MRILAHRGSPGPSTAENTVPAVLAALDAGADGVEVDLRLSADGVLVVLHDADLRRVAGAPLDVHRATWDELRATAGAAGVPLARVEWVLAAAAGCRVVLEIKAPPEDAGRAATVDALVERLAVLHAGRLPLQVTVSSFDAPLVAAVRAALPPELGVRTALLARPGCLPLAVLGLAVAGGHDELHPHVTDLLEHPRVVASAASCGLGVVPWTVNSCRAVRRCADLGAAAVLTDVPRGARAALLARSAAGRRTGALRAVAAP